MNYGWAVGKLILGGNKYRISWCFHSWLYRLKLFGEGVTSASMVCLAPVDSAISTQLWDTLTTKAILFPPTSPAWPKQFSPSSGRVKAFLTVTDCVVSLDELWHNLILSKLQSTGNISVICCNRISVPSRNCKVGWNLVLARGHWKERRDDG